MNSLNIDKEVKKVDFTYTTTSLKFTGTCYVSADKVVSDIQAQIFINGDASTNIGNCSSNGNTTVNIWNSTYKSYIDTAATDFKALQQDIASHYSTTTFSEETL